MATETKLAVKLCECEEDLLDTFEAMLVDHEITASEIAMYRRKLRAAVKLADRQRAGIERGTALMLFGLTPKLVKRIRQEFVDQQHGSLVALPTAHEPHEAA